MEHKRHGRRGLEWVDALPFLAGAIILVAVPLVFILSYASSRYAAAICGSPSAEVSSPAASATPTPTPEATQEPEEAVCRYEEVELTEEDAYILACLVYHEARGEPFEGQAAVVEVVFNRCLSDEFPDTVEEVVFQKYGDVWQFSPAPYLYTAEPDETQYSAVMYAYNAEEPIVPPETVFFSTSPYNEHVTAIIGNHYFCEVADGKTVDERFLPVLYELDERAEWTDPQKWVKANPGLGTIKQYATLADFVERAKKNPEDLPGVLCKDFNVPEVAATVWLSFEDIKSDAVFSMQDVYNTYAIGGCDLSATTDLTCASLLIRRSADDPIIYVVQHYFIPQKRIDQLTEHNSQGGRSMAIGNSYLTSVRQYMRLTTKAHDSEIKDLINAARADLALGGVLEVKALDEKDPLILRAVATYVKAEFGLDNPDAEKYRASYKEQRNALTLSDSYIKATEEG